MDLNKYYNYYLNLNTYSRIEDAKKTISNIVNSFKNIGLKDDEIYPFITDIFLCASSSDYKTCKSEYEFFVSTTNSTMSYDEFNNKAKSIVLKDAKEYIDDLIDKIGKLDVKLKANIVILIICICSVNGTMTVDEQNFIKTILY